MRTWWVIVPGFPSRERENRCPTNASDVKEIGDQQRKCNELPGIHLPYLPCVKQRDAIGGKKEPALIVASLRNTLRSLSLPCRLPHPKIVFHISSWNQVIFAYFVFGNWNLHFSYNYHNYSISGMFRNVPGCSMFLILSTASSLT